MSNTITALPLTRLIAELEASPKASIALNIKIGLHLGWRRLSGTPEMAPCDVDIARWALPDGRPRLGLPRWCWYVDEALTLIPASSGYTLGAGKVSLDEPLYGAIIYRTAHSNADADEIGTGEHSSSLALTIIIAALRARAWLARAPV